MAIASSFLHDALCAIWLFVYMAIKGRLKDTVRALKTRSGLVVIAGALLGGLFGAWAFTASTIPRLASGVVALPALAGAASYLFYYRGISKIGAARAMALNISYSAWAVVFAFVLQGTVPTMASVLCCVVILVGTILAARGWNGLLARKG